MAKRTGSMTVSIERSSSMPESVAAKSTRAIPAARDGEPAAGVQVTDLTRSYGSHRVLHGISFQVPQGSVCTLLGASGSGKTTTLRLLAGLDRPDGGEIWIAGNRVAGRGVLVPAEKRGVGLLFQAYALLPHMTRRVSFCRKRKPAVWRYCRSVTGTN